MYRALVTVILAVHFGFVGYVVAGGFLGWRWRAAIWPHLAAVGWGALGLAVSLECPLTAAEQWARRRAGQPTTDVGFIDRYIDGVIYPQRYAWVAQVLVGLLVAVSWAGTFVIARRRAAARAAGRTSTRSEQGASPRDGQ